MARTPSLLALLGIAAVAGYQNRDKLGQVLGGTEAGRTPSGGQSGGGLGGGLSDLLSGLGGGSGRGFGDLGSATTGGNSIAEGLRDLIAQFSGTGQREVAESWVGSGPNRTLSPSELESNLGPDLIAELSERTGLARDDLLQRLSVSLPETVDTLTPAGRLPDSPSGNPAGM